MLTDTKCRATSVDVPDGHRSVCSAPAIRGIGSQRGAGHDVLSSSTNQIPECATPFSLSQYVLPGAFFGVLNWAFGQAQFL
jgi:hypothetical protein